MELRGLLLVTAAALGLLTPPAGAQATNHWRIFTASDGLAETACLSVTPGANGDVLVRHPALDAISLFDGYSFTAIPGPGGRRHRVYESPSGQLWTVAPEGLRELREGEWSPVPVAPVAEHFRAERTNEIVLLPVRQGRVLVLLPDELLQVVVENSDHSRTESLLLARQASLGEFRTMIAARNGALWIAGKSGYAKSLQPFRALTPDGKWETTSEMPFEFSERMVAPSSAIPGSATVADRVGDAGGVIWLATSAGLARCAPPIWERQPGAQPPAPITPALSVKDRAVIEATGELASWKTVFKARNSDLWLGSDNKVAWVRDETLQVFTSTNQLGPEQVSAFVESPDGRIVCATPTKVWEFDGRNWLALRSGFDHVNALCYTRSGTLWVASNNGLHRCVRGAWVRNDLADGLPSACVTDVYEDAAGQILARTAAGQSRFNPEADIAPPRTFIRPLPGERQQIREGNAIRLAFSGRDRWNVTTPERLLFSFRLDEREWSPFQDLTEVVFADLPVGKHYFQVRAMDRNANLDPQPAKLVFAIVLPWYRETRLVVILTGALGVAVFFAALAFNRHRRLQHSYADVERQVAERTRELELAQRELLHSQKMNALGTLSAGIAHDFNNILSIVKGSAQIIEDNPDDPEKIHTRVDRIKTVVQQGAGIVEAMLGFSRQSPDQTAPADMNAIVEDTLKLLGDRFLRETVVKFDRGVHLPEIFVARDFVQQILLNLIFNAAEAIERHQPAGQTRSQITVRTQLTNTLPAGLFLKPAAADTFIQISVTDTGGGITPENLPRIFEPFFTTKAMSSQRGTGLGLTMVYELARKLEAGLAVKSQPGTGSAFTLILPLKRP